jgi:hypothetical protein
MENQSSEILNKLNLGVQEPLFARLASFKIKIIAYKPFRPAFFAGILPAPSLATGFRPWLGKNALFRAGSIIQKYEAPFNAPFSFFKPLLKTIQLLTRQ